MTRFSAVFPLVVAALLGGVVGGLVVSRFPAPREGSSVQAEPSRQADVAAGAPLESRVLALEEKVARLARRPPGVSALLTPGAASGPEDAGVVNAAPVVDDPVFEVAVRDIVDRVEDERSTERDLRRDEQRRRISETWVNELGLELSLNEAQKAKVGEIVTEMFQRLRELRTLDAGAVRRSERIARMRAVSDDAEKKLSGVLDATQMAAYRGLDEDLRLTGRSLGRR